MGDPTLGPIPDEAVGFNLNQADIRFKENLASSQSGEEVVKAIDELVWAYSDAVVDSLGIDKVITYLSEYVAALSELKKISPDLRSNINPEVYEFALKIFDGLSDEQIEKSGTEEQREKGETELDRLEDQVEEIFVEIGAVKE